MGTLVRITWLVGLVLTASSLLVAGTLRVGDSVGPFAAIGTLMTVGATLAAAAREFTALEAARQRANSRDDPYTCVHCGYDLVGLPAGRCPECGTVRLEQARTP